MEFTFSIDDANAVWGYASNQVEPCLYQPDWPDTTPWADRSEAEAWAIQWVNHMNDPENNEPPQNRKNS